MRSTTRIPLKLFFAASLFGLAAENTYAEAQSVFRSFIKTAREMRGARQPGAWRKVREAAYQKHFGVPAPRRNFPIATNIQDVHFFQASYDTLSGNIGTPSADLWRRFGEYRNFPSVGLFDHSYDNIGSVPGFISEIQNAASPNSLIILTAHGAMSQQIQLARGGARLLAEDFSKIDFRGAHVMLESCFQGGAYSRYWTDVWSSAISVSRANAASVMSYQSAGTTGMLFQKFADVLSNDMVRGRGWRDFAEKASTLDGTVANRVRIYSRVPSPSQLPKY